MTERDKEYLRCLTRALKLFPRDRNGTIERIALNEAWDHACERLGVSEEEADRLEAQVHKQLQHDGWLPT